MQTSQNHHDNKWIKSLLPHYQEPSFIFFYSELSEVSYSHKNMKLDSRDSLTDTEKRDIEEKRFKKSFYKSDYQW